MSSTIKSEDGSPSSCWICLCDEPDDTGLLPLRDCSCRGDTGAGYAHLSCLVQYAQTKSLEVSNNPSQSGNLEKFFEAWEKCPNCEQSYQHQLVIDLADSLLKFMDENYGEYNHSIDYVRMFNAHLVKIDALKIGSMERLGKEGIQIAREGVKLVEDMKRKYITNAIIAPSASIQRLVSDNEARAYHNLSTLYVLDMSNGGVKRNSLEKAIYYAEKSRIIYKSIGDAAAVDGLERTLNMIKMSCHPDRNRTMRQVFNETVEREGAESGKAIDNAKHLAGALRLDNCIIEAERLLTKYLPISRRVHGEEHSQTKEIAMALDKLTARFVSLDNEEEFKALRYEDEGEKCVVQGPLQEGDYIKLVVEVEGATEYTVDSSSLLIANGTPIVCQGLVKGAHLNGKLADVRSFDKDKERYTIYFEDTKLKPAAVKKENVRIVFDLPDAE